MNRAPPLARCEDLAAEIALDVRRRVHTARGYDFTGNPLPDAAPLAPAPALELDEAAFLADEPSRFPREKEVFEGLSTGRQP